LKVVRSEFLSRGRLLLLLMTILPGLSLTTPLGSESTGPDLARGAPTGRPRNDRAFHKMSLTFFAR
jgi:hypothetical protein